MSKDLPDQPLVSKVEIPRFMGKWYVIANIPTFLEKNAYNATETYTWNSDADRIDIDFRFNKGSYDGPEKAVPQKGFIFNTKTCSEWRVQPFWPLKFAYLIVDLAPDYSDTIIGVPNRGHVWIMARTPTISSERLSTLTAKVKSLGYDLEKLQKVPQKTN